MNSNLLHGLPKIVVLSLRHLRTIKELPVLSLKMLPKIDEISRNPEAAFLVILDLIARKGIPPETVIDWLESGKYQVVTTCPPPPAAVHPPYRADQ